MARITTLILALCLLAADASAAEDKLVVYRVPKRGARLTPYQIVAIEMRNELTRRGHSPKLVETEGSLDTLLSLESHDGPAIGLVQGDVLYHYMHGGHPQFPHAHGATRVRALARVFPEWLFIWGAKRGDGRITGSNKTAFLGTLGSGTLVTALNVTEILGLRWKEQWYEPRTPRHRLEDHEVAFGVLSPIAGRAPEPAFGFNQSRRSYLTVASAKLVASSFPNVYRLVDRNEMAARLPGSVPHDAATVSCSAILVGTRQLPDSIVEDIIEVLQAWDNSWQERDLDALLPFRERPSDDPAVRRESVLAATSFGDFAGDGRLTELPIASHRYVRVQNLDDEFSKMLISYTSEGFLELALFIPLLFWIILYLIKMYEDVHGQTQATMGSYARYMFQRRNRRWLAFVAGYVAAHVVIATMIWLHEYYAESGRPESAIASSGWPGAVQWIFKNATLAQGESRPEATASYMWLGLLKMGYAVTGVIISLVLSGQIIQRIRGGTRMRDHVMVLGWNAGVEAVVGDLKEQYRALGFELGGADDAYPILVLREVATLEDNREAVTRQNVHYAEFHHATLSQELAKHHYADARSVIILCPTDDDVPKDRPSGDGWVLQTLAGVRAFESADDYIGERKVIIVEVADEGNRRVAKGLKADDVVCVRNFGGELLAHGAMKPGLPEVFRLLLETDKESHELYTAKVTERNLQAIAGANAKDITTYSDLRRLRAKSLADSDEVKNMILLGILRWNPKKGEWTPHLNPYQEGEAGPDSRNDGLGDDVRLLVLSTEPLPDSTAGASVQNRHVGP